MSARRCAAALVVVIGIVAAVTPSLAPRVLAQDRNYAGLVVAHGDGRVVTQCVAFEEESISGAELLVRSGLDLSMEAGGIGATICRIDGEGCDYPGEACFCQCQGSPCIYWSYWRLDGDKWLYSNAGAANTRVGDGAVEGWSWGPGTVEKAQEPPLHTFADLCAGDEGQRTAAPQSSNAQAEPALQVTERVPTSAALSGSGVPPATQPNEAVTQFLSPLTAFGVLFGVLVALPVLVLGARWLGRGRQERQP